MVYGSATGPRVATQPASRRFLHQYGAFGSRSDTASELAMWYATAPGAKRQQSTYFASEYQPQYRAASGQAAGANSSGLSSRVTSRPASPSSFAMSRSDWS